MLPLCKKHLSLNCPGRSLMMKWLSHRSRSFSNRIFNAARKTINSTVYHIIWNNWFFKSISSDQGVCKTAHAFSCLFSLFLLFCAPVPTFTFVFLSATIKTQTWRRTRKWARFLFLRSSLLPTDMSTVLIWKATSSPKKDQRFSSCREEFQNHMYDSPEKIQGISFGAMERMDSPQGYTPEGFT